MKLIALIFALLILPSIFSAEHFTAAQRLEPKRLQALHEDRLRFARERQTLPNLGVYEDYRAVIHVHAEDSNHTKGTRPEVLEAAKKTGVRIVMFTDHGGPKPETWRGLRDDVLFIAGEENGGAGLLRFPADGSETNELKFLSHIEERYDASPEGFAGMEISNRHTDAVVDPEMATELIRAAGDPERWKQFVANFQKFPDEVFAVGTDYREKIFEKWDKENAAHPFTGIAANDAHQNQIYQGTTFDPYEVSFRNLSTHILARELTDSAVRESLREGRAYVSHDWLCDPSGFAFGAANNLGVFTMGDTAIMLKGTRLVGITPIAAKLKLFHGGKVVEEARGTNLVFTATEPGGYRLEAWLSAGGEDRPWIYSNPVYLRAPALADLKLPSNELSPSVEAKKDIKYLDDDPKQQLDVYSPKGAAGAPVFFFVHGGAWRSGDRSQYPAIANRLAKNGIVTVVPSYRLAPQNKHPAQIEDVAAAFAWTVRHVAQFGGDTNRIFVGGHSAGGHLSALLALNEKYLQKHGLAAKNIRGVAALSGVYDLANEGQESVFGSDLDNRKDASPLQHIRSSAPPFVVSYCQWDYATLPGQARTFHAALDKAGITSQLIFVPRENHISEMVNFPNESDPTAAAVIKLCKTEEVSK